MGEQTLDPAIQPPVVNSKEEFIEAVKQSGLVGLGGWLPAHIKLNPKDKIEYLCINAAECEPYITADVREITRTHENVLYGISQVRNTLVSTRL